MTTATVPVGTGPPVTLTIPVTSPQGGLDLTTVSAAQLKVQAPDGTSYYWSAATANVTPTSLTVTHVLQYADLYMPGQWKFEVYFTIPGGGIACYPVFLDVTR